MKVKMNVERVREVLENPEHTGLSEVDLAVLAALVGSYGDEVERASVNCSPARKAKRKPRPQRIKKGKRK